MNYDWTPPTGPIITRRGRDLGMGGRIACANDSHVGVFPFPPLPASTTLPRATRRQRADHERLRSLYRGVDGGGWRKFLLSDKAKRWIGALMEGNVETRLIGGPFVKQPLPPEKPHGFLSFGILSQIGVLASEYMLWVRALHVHCVVSHEKMTKANMDNPFVTFYSEVHADGNVVEWLHGVTEKTGATGFPWGAVNYLQSIAGI